MEDSYFKTRLQYDEKRKHVWKVIANYLQKYVSENDKILDIGCGYCDFINSIVAKEKHALDESEQMLKYADEDVIPHIQSCVDMKNFDSEYFDVIFASNIFEHLKWEEFLETIQEIKRILKSNGRLIIIQPNFRYAYKEYFDDYTHRLIFTHIGLCDLLVGQGFKITELIPNFLPFSMKSRLPSSPTLLKLYLRLPYKPFAKQMLIIAEKI